MSHTTDQLVNERKVVVVFDICSSTTLLEELLRTENHQRWRNLLIRQKKFLVTESRRTPFEIYKFVGDGWILLFHDNVAGVRLMQFLEKLSANYAKLFAEDICDVLSCSDYTVGLSFGIDAGTVVKLVMLQTTEYVGRPLNVACRLQGAIRQGDKHPEGKVLVSKSAYVQLGLAKSPKYAGKPVARTLRNVVGGENYLAMKIRLSS